MTDEQKKPIEEELTDEEWLNTQSYAGNSLTSERPSTRREERVKFRQPTP